MDIYKSDRTVKVIKKTVKKVTGMIITKGRVVVSSGREGRIVLQEC